MISEYDSDVDAGYSRNGYDKVGIIICISVAYLSLSAGFSIMVSFIWKSMGGDLVSPATIPLIILCGAAISIALVYPTFRWVLHD